MLKKTVGLQSFLTRKSLRFRGVAVVEFVVVIAGIGALIALLFLGDYVASREFPAGRVVR